MLYMIQPLVLALTLAAPAIQDLSILRAQVERPMIVNGEKADPLLVKRFLVYGVGAPLIEVATREGLIEIYSRQQGILPAPASNEAFDANLNRFKREHGEDVLDAAIHREFGSPAIANRSIRVAAQFDALFLPDNPNHWPKVTLDALKEEADGDVLRDAFDSYAAKLEAGGPIQPESEVYKGYLREVVELHLLEQLSARTWSDGLPADIVLQLEGKGAGQRVQLSLEEAFDSILPALDPDTIARERRWVAGLLAVEQSLRQQGLLLEKTEAKRIYEDQLQAEQGTFLSTISVAIYSDYFPSLEHFQAYRRCLDSFERTFQEDDALVEKGQLSTRLKRHTRGANQLMGLARVDARIMHFTARDPRAGTSSERSWREAYDRAAAALATVRTSCKDIPSSVRREEAGDLWRDLSAVLSDQGNTPSFLYPKPNPRSSSGTCRAGRHRSYGKTSYHDFQRLLNSSYYEDLQVAKPSAAWVFFDQAIESVSPPLRTPEGYTLVWLLDRKDPTHPLRLDKKRHVRLLRNYAVRQEFGALWREALGSARIR